ncbi:autotransporter outer membrane beta-barrel domain-containing protein [Flavobacterium sp. 1355]|jgi:outer membrane autotransporter protein|uniref:autotransporter outer membrane beta-barrel domain-containing protein n=1 Tax=Flavobacterium sp. 1355 TaxID=2806571 RepID=UPI001AE7198B|nr:autotransporter outer membrane beta-barrel domain-containing protein [Flavobacterium sp. 1355]MBP1225890.1 outer membrane autotransporter protein [Flavobacterium sp. 1355]
MKLTLHCIFISIALISLFPNLTNAQTEGNFIKASIGFGSSTSNYEEENPEIIDGFGFYAEGEYVMGVTKWFSIRPYAGVILTSSDDDKLKNPQGYKVETKAFFLGGKVRLCAPIPWVAPFIEAGIGTSLGSFETYTEVINVKKNGAQFHIPIGLGLAVGRKNNIEIGISFYAHPSAEQSFGGFTAGYSFPLD